MGENVVTVNVGTVRTWTLQDRIAAHAATILEMPEAWASSPAALEAVVYALVCLLDWTPADAPRLALRRAWLASGVIAQAGVALAADPDSVGWVETVAVLRASLCDLGLVVR